MAFSNPLVTVLKVFDNLGRVALNIFSGASSQGYGQAVMQFSTNSADETFPAEIVASNYSDGTNQSDALILTSPGIAAGTPLHDPAFPPSAYSGRSQIILYAGDNSTGLRGRDTILLLADRIEIQGDAATGFPNGILAITSDIDWNGATAIFRGAVTLDGTTSFKSAAGYKPLEDTGWVTLARSNTGTHTIGGGVVPAARRINGVVFLRGNIVALTPAATLTEIAVLPVGMRPGVTTNYPVSTNSTITMTMQITTGGSVLVWSSATSAGWLSLSGGTFPADN